MNVKRLKEARERKYSTQAKFAEALGVPQGTVGRWESGIRVPKSTMRERIAELLEVSQDYLFGVEADEHGMGEREPHRFRLTPYVALLDMARCDAAKMAKGQREAAGKYIFKAAIVLGGPKVLTVGVDGQPAIIFGTKDRAYNEGHEHDPEYEFDIVPYQNILDTALEDSKIASSENIDEAVDILKKIMRELAF